jgi:hypothetical protein
MEGRVLGEQVRPTRLLVRLHFLDECLRPRRKAPNLVQAAAGRRAAAAVFFGSVVGVPVEENRNSVPVGGSPSRVANCQASRSRADRRLWRQSPMTSHHQTGGFSTF